MKKSFLLIGVVLDIVIISIILLTALNVVKITNSVNAFVVENKIDDIHTKAMSMLDNIHTKNDFTRKIKDSKISKDFFGKDTSYELEKKLLSYNLDSQNVFNFVYASKIIKDVIENNVTENNTTENNATENNATENNATIENTFITNFEINKIILKIKDKSGGVILTKNKIIYK